MSKHLVIGADYHNLVKQSEINHRILTDPRGFVEESEAVYRDAIDTAAVYVKEHIRQSRIVMLAGPSGSGKTTSARLIRDSLLKHGIRAHTIELDHYYLDVDRSDPTINYELPSRLDLPLMLEHMNALAKGEKIMLPEFDFPSGKQILNVTPMQLASDEVAIFEGIHALNDIFRKAEADPIDIYVSARMRITDDDGNVLIEPQETRFLRRGVRDMRCRGADFVRTLSMWPNVLSGEQKFIMPFKKYADLTIDTSFDYEVNLMAQFAASHLDSLDKNAMEALHMEQLAKRLTALAPLDASYVPGDSMLREFIGTSGV